jgi:riboflavin kinase/FMN adenylyltransferase
MQLFRTTADIPSSLHHSVVAIGNFDGVHKGHRALLKQAQALATAHHVPWMVMTFHPHPRRYFQPDIPAFALETFSTRLRRVQALHPDAVLVLPFNGAMAHMRAEDFVREILVEKLRIEHVVVGEDFCFGAKRAGTVQFLQEEAVRYGFGCSLLSPVLINHYAASSSRIRSLLAQGEMAEVAQILGRPYSVIGRVQHGDKRGRTLGTPTINLAMHGLHIPRHGVYVARLSLEGQNNVPAIVNIGVRPTFGGDAVARLEAHALQPIPEIYGQKVQLELHHFLRDEQHFESSNALQAQIKHDIALAWDYIRQGWHA